MIRMDVKNRLLAEAARQMQKLVSNGIDAALGETYAYQQKILLKEKGILNLWYSPKNDSYKFTFNEIRDSSLAKKIEDLLGSTINGAKNASQQKLDGYHVFTDGSHKDGRVGYAFVVVKDGKKIHSEHGAIEGDSFSDHHNVTGEIRAVLEACKYMEKESISEFSLHYDYNGLEKWAKQEWKANTKLTRDYRSFFETYPGRIDWVKVKGHSGNRFNEMADRLAGKDG